MSLTSCQVHFTNRSSVYASPSLLKQLQLKPTTSCTLSFGRSTTKITLRKSKKSGMQLHLPLFISKRILLSSRGQYSIISMKDGGLKLGPLIGIMTTSTASSTRPFGTRTPLIRQFVSYGNRKGTCYAFSPSNIHWPSQTVIGHFYNRQQGWHKKKVPLPDVVYNRMPSRRAEKLVSMEQLKTRMLRRNIPVFNWSFFEKWDVYRLLERDEAAFRYVPESYIDPSPEQLRKLIKKHSFVYLKPTGGSLGKGIYRLTYKQKQGYYARYRGNGKNRLIRFQRFSALMRMLGSNKGRLRNYVAQQGIKLLEIDACPIDFRFHLNKNAKNRWIIAGIGCKKAGRGSVTTHVRTGGKLLTPEQALHTLFSKSQSEQLLQSAKEVSIKLAEAIEQNYAHHIGELGFDLGIDKDGRIWMFEANAKPGRSIYKHSALKPQGVTTLEHLFDYCQYLSGFRKEG